MKTKKRAATSLPVFMGPSGFVAGLARFPSVLLVERVPCFTALRVRVFAEYWHAYALEVFFGKVP